MLKIHAPLRTASESLLSPHICQSRASRLALETQSRGKLHAHTRMTVPHGFLYVAHSRVKNAASVDVNTYVANYVAKGRSASEQWRNATGVPFEA